MEVQIVVETLEYWISNLRQVGIVSASRISCESLPPQGAILGCGVFGSPQLIENNTLDVHCNAMVYLLFQVSNLSFFRFDSNKSLTIAEIFYTYPKGKAFPNIHQTCELHKAFMVIV